MHGLEFRTFGIIVTYKCNIECADCCFSCNPQRKERFSLEQIKQLIDEATELGSTTIVFTGGEPTLLGYELDEAIAWATQRGNKTRIVTNGWWGKTLDTARKHLSRWKTAGLKTLNISVDDFHQAFVPIHCIENAVAVANEMNIQLIIGCAELKGSTITAEKLSHRLPGATPYGAPKMGLVSIARLPVLPFGEGTRNVDNDQLMTYADLESSFNTGCPMVLSSPSIHPDGRVTACCGLFTSEIKDLDLGRWPDHSLREIILAGENDVLMNWIKFEGLGAIRDYIKKLDPNIEFRSKYSNICHLCGDIFKRPEVRRILYENLEQVRDRVLMAKVKSIAGRPSAEFSRNTAIPSGRTRSERTPAAC